MIGTSIGQYEVRRRLGEGGMGVVYYAVHRVLGTERAVKVLQPEWTAHPEVVQRFINEARAAAAIRHRNIIGVHDCGQLPGGEWYILLDYLEGGTLTGFLRSHGGPLPVHDALHLLAEAANGVQAAHEHEIVHRDLKPDNLFLSQRDGDPHFVTVLDFGVAKLGEQRLGKALTSAGMILGTPAYMAPEQMRGEAATPASDLFALGVIAYQMVTGGQLPFQREGESYHRLSLEELHRRSARHELVDARARCPHLSAEWADAIRGALHHEPGRRPPSARAFVLALAQATAGDGYSADGLTIVRTYASELLSFGAAEVTARASTEQAAASSPGPATRLSRYRLDRRLGIGGMAEVYLGTVLGADGFARPVAVKRVLAGFAQEPRFAEMFISEAQLAARLHHPNIVSVLDFDRDEQGRPFLVMEHIDGKDLAELAATGPLPPAVAIFLATEMLRGLGYAHRPPASAGMLGLVHRDVSPHNVLLSWEGAVKVSDFGIAKAFDEGGLARSEMLKGKVSYMSPEQANAEPIDRRSDLFAVGIVLWELLTGRRLFGGTSMEALARVFHAPILPPAQVRPQVSPELSAIVMRLLERERERRYAFAEEAIEDLARCAEAPRNGPAELARTLAERFGRPVARLATSSREPEDGGGPAAGRPVIEAAPWSPSPPQSNRLGAPSAAPLVAGPALPRRGGRRKWLMVACITLLSVAMGVFLAKRAGRLAVTEHVPALAIDAAVAPAVAAPVDASAAVATPADAAVDAPSAAAAEVAPGTLVVDAVPWATLWINGKPSGVTPFRGRMAPGRYRLKLRNAKAEKSITVTVRSAKTTVIRESLEGTP